MVLSRLLAAPYLTSFVLLKEAVSFKFFLLGIFFLPIYFVSRTMGIGGSSAVQETAGELQDP